TPPGPGGRLDVMDADFDLSALVRPGEPGQAVLVSVLHHHGGGKRPGVADKAVEGRFRHRLRLEPGDNFLEVVAVNKDAPAAFAEAETARLPFTVSYRKK